MYIILYSRPISQYNIRYLIDILNDSHNDEKLMTKKIQR